MRRLGFGYAYRAGNREPASRGRSRSTAGGRVRWRAERVSLHSWGGASPARPRAWPGRVGKAVRRATSRRGTGRGTPGFRVATARRAAGGQSVVIGGWVLDADALSGFAAGSSVYAQALVWTAVK